MSDTTEQPTTDAVSQAITLAQKHSLSKATVQSIPLTVPGYDSLVHVQPTGRGVRVFSNHELLVSGMLYSFDGFMILHPATQRWYFVGNNTITPKLSSKVLEPLLTAITETVNEYIKSKPGFTEAMGVVAWESKRFSLVQDIENEQYQIRRIEQQRQQAIDAHNQRMLSWAGDIVRYQERLNKAETALLAHLQSVPTLDPELVKIEPDNTADMAPS